MRYPHPDGRQPSTVVTETTAHSIPDTLVQDAHPASDSTGDGSHRESTSHISVINVLIVDDHALMREGLRQLFMLEEDIQIVGEAVDGFEAMEKIPQLHPDIVLMDIHLPVVDGIAITRQITRQFPDISVLMLTMHQQHQQIVDAMKSGAKGYLLKNASAREVAQAIRAIHAGEIVVAPALTGAIVNELRRQSDTTPGGQSIAQLSEKEVEIIRYLASGMSNKEIAEHLAYSEKTVKNYLSIIFQKLHLRDRTQVAIFALRQGLLPDEEL